MEKAGDFQSRVPLSDLAVMGFDILYRLPQLYGHLRETTQYVRQTHPPLLLTIDAPEFTLRVAKALRHTPIRKVHCVAPSVWAWRPGRARRIAPFLDHLLTLFPFEPPFFVQHGLASTFVGHPLAEKPLGDASIIWARYPSLSPDKPLLLLIPGSRESEIQKLLPIFLDTVLLLQPTFPSLGLALPTLPHLRPLVQSLLQERSSLPCVVLDDVTFHPHLWAAGTAALAASGTVTLELALAGLPHVVAYHVSPLLAWGLKQLLKTPWVSLPNIIVQETVVPECLQKMCTPDILAAHLHPLIAKEKAYALQREVLYRIRTLLKTPLSFGPQAAQILKTFL